MKTTIFANQCDRSEAALYKGLTERGHSLHLIHSPDWNANGLFDNSSITTSTIKVTNRLDFSAIKELKKQLTDIKPDIIYAPTNKTLSVSLIATKGLPIRVIGYRGTIGHVKRFNPASWLTYLNPNLAHIVSVSEAVRQHLINDVKISKDKVTTIYKGHNIAWYQTPDKIDLQLLGVPEDAVVVGFAGNMRPVKGVDILIKALDHLPKTSKIHLLLIGDVRDKTVEKLTALPQYKNRLTLTGYRSDAPALISTCDIFVMPSIEREGLPRAVIEAMAMRLPVIVSDVGGMPEQVINNESGLVVPPSNPKKLAPAIQTLADSKELRIKLGNAAHDRIISTFNINTTIDKMEKLFKSMVIPTIPV